MSNRIRKVIAAYMHWKYEADKNLSKRTAFKWTILRPGGLTNDPGVGTASIGRTHLTKTITVSTQEKMDIFHNLMKFDFQRNDVAKALALLVDREDAAGLAVDYVGGDTPIEEGLNAFIAKGETDFLG